MIPLNITVKLPVWFAYSACTIPIHGCKYTVEFTAWEKKKKRKRDSVQPWTRVSCLVVKYSTTALWLLWWKKGWFVCIWTAFASFLTKILYDLRHLCTNAQHTYMFPFSEKLVFLLTKTGLWYRILHHSCRSLHYHFEWRKYCRSLG